LEYKKQQKRPKLQTDSDTGKGMNGVEIPDESVALQSTLNNEECTALSKRMSKEFCRLPGAGRKKSVVR
jgi:hypothetical protein